MTQQTSGTKEFHENQITSLGFKENPCLTKTLATQTTTNKEKKERDDILGD